MKSCQAPSTKGHLEEPRKFNEALSSFRKHTSISKGGEGGSLWGIKCLKSLDCPLLPRTLWSGDMCPASPMFSDRKPLPERARVCVCVEHRGSEIFFSIALLPYDSLLPLVHGTCTRMWGCLCHEGVRGCS